MESTNATASAQDDPFACCYAQGRSGARDFRANVARVSTPADFLLALDQFFPAN